MIHTARYVVVALALAFPALAQAQWMWVDKDGRKVLSDQAPPVDVPAKNILRQPGNRKPLEQPAEAVASAPAKPVLPVSVTGGKDKALEEKKKAAEAAEAEKVKQQRAELDRTRADNCLRAKNAKATLDSGARIARTNAKGEREFIDDSARAAEGKRLDGIITRDCAASTG